MIWSYWLPIALKLGVDYNSFWKLNPRKIMLMLEGYTNNLRIEADLQGWTNGYYICMALANSFGEDAVYPKRPELFTEYEEPSRQDEMSQFMAQVERHNNKK